MRLWRPFRRRRGFRQHGLCEIQVRGLGHLATAAAEDQGVLITPNHCSHADPFVLLEAADQFQSPFYFMTAWQVFGMTHRIGRQVLRQHGCFSINREGHDVRAVRCAVDVLAAQRQPLVIFPEGEVFHLNDCLMPFRRGAATVALLAARRGHRPVACVPCAIKFQFVEDPTPNLQRLASRLEEKLLGTQYPTDTLENRVGRLIETGIGRCEIAHLGKQQQGALNGRVAHLIGTLLAELNTRYQLPEFRGSIPEQVKRLRFHIIRCQELQHATANQQAQCAQDLKYLFQVMQLFSYPVDYLAHTPTLERLAETLDKLEEDLLGVPTAGIRGLRRAVVTFGEPVVVQPQAVKKTSAELLTRRLQSAVDMLLSPAPVPSSHVDPVRIAPPSCGSFPPSESVSPLCLPAF
jgi:1-acyl-sn-glycerol-3-phosphate acyltransferase